MGTDQARPRSSGAQSGPAQPGEDTSPAREPREHEDAALRDRAERERAVRSAAQGAYARLAREAIDRLAASEMRDRILESALFEAGHTTMPEDAAGFGAFARGPLRAAVERALGAEAANAILSDLRPALGPEGSPSASGVRPASDALRAPPSPCIDGWSDPTRADPLGPTVTARCVVLAHDDGDWRARVARLLADAGYLALAAPDGLMGLERCIEEHPAAVVAALRMATLDGAQLAAVLRSRFGEDAPPVLLIADGPLPEPPPGAVAMIRSDAIEADLVQELAAWIGPGAPRDPQKA